MDLGPKTPRVEVSDRSSHSFICVTCLESHLFVLLQLIPCQLDMHVARHLGHLSYLPFPRPVALTLPDAHSEPRTPEPTNQTKKKKLHKRSFTNYQPYRPKTIQR